MSRKRIDWDAIEPEWRAGIRSKLEISEAFDVSRAALDKHFAKCGIERDLTAKIQARADALVTYDAVTREVTPESKVTEKELIEANAAQLVHVRRDQRKDIQRSRKLVMSLLDELEEQTGNIDLYYQLGELMNSPDDKGMDKLNELYRKVISLNGRTGTMKSLADSLKTLVGLERQAFGLKDGADEAKKPLDESAINERLALLLAK